MIAGAGWSAHFRGLGVDAEPATDLPDALARLTSSGTTSDRYALASVALRSHVG
ncbi:MAG: hypothetical protein ACR2K3_04610 [Nocardioides sp.]